LNLAVGSIQGYARLLGRNEDRTPSINLLDPPLISETETRAVHYTLYQWRI